MDNNTLVALAEKNIEVGHSGMKLFRQAALREFSEKGFTQLNPEFYRFTNVERFLSEVTYGPHTSDVDLDKYLDPQFETLLFVNGELVSKPQIKGIEVHSLNDKFTSVKDSFSTGDVVSTLHHSFMTVSYTH